MKRIVTIIIMAAGIIFIGKMVTHYFPSVRETAFNAGTYPVSYWLCFLVAMVIMAFWAQGKKGKR